jgi:DNA-binding IclR family transcriptional regulator
LSGPDVAANSLSGDRLSRLFDVLELLVAHPSGMSVTEVSKQLGLPISSAHNLLQRLVAAEAVVASEGPRYSVGSRLVRLSIRTVNSLEIRTLSRRHLERLVGEIGDDVYLAVRLGVRVLYVERLPGTRPITIDIRLGQALLLHATSVGKLFAAHYPQLTRRMLSRRRATLTDRTLTDVDRLMAELETIRKQGYAINHEEAIRGVVGLAVPIMDASDELVAAVHISALREQMDDERICTVLDAMQVTARAIGKELGR